MSPGFFGSARTLATRPLSKREKHTMIIADRLARKAGSFSISYVVTARRLQVLAYYNKPNQAGSEDAAAATKPPVPLSKASKAPAPPAAAPAAAQSRTHPTSAPSRPPAARKPAPVQKSAPRSKVHRNSLSARSGVKLSDAAIAAQARADSSSSQPARKRLKPSPSELAHPALPPGLDGHLVKRKAPVRQPVHLPARAASPIPSPASDSGDECGEYDEHESDGGDPTGLFSSRADAASYLTELNWDLYINERTGGLMGYDRATGKEYGGAGNTVTPPEVITAYMLVHEGEFG